MVNNNFDNNILFQEIKSKAFSSLMNKDHYAKQLAYYCDYEMKIGIKGQSEKIIDEKLNDIISVFKYVNNKMLFQYEYSKLLTDRLLLSRTQSIQAEEVFISKLKHEQGGTFVNKMISMLQDLDNSRIILEHYRLQSSHRGQPEGINFSCYILQNGAWDLDSNKYEKFILPTSIERCLNDFSLFYLQTKKNHKLNFIYSSGFIEFKITYLKKPYQSVSSLLQYVILLLLEKHENKGGRLNIKELLSLLNIQKNQLTNEIFGLIYNPLFNPNKDKSSGILGISSNSQVEIMDNDEVWINKDFTSNSLRINTISNIKKISIQEDVKDNQNLASYQNALIDSVISKIMKRRQREDTTHVILVQMVIKEIVSFKCGMSKVKERIEALIEKGIIKRNENDNNLYEYIS